MRARRSVRPRESQSQWSLQCGSTIARGEQSTLLIIINGLLARNTLRMSSGGVGRALVAAGLVRLPPA